MPRLLQLGTQKLSAAFETEDWETHCVDDIGGFNYMDFEPGYFDAIYATPSDDEVVATLVVLARFHAKHWAIDGAEVPGLEQFRKGSTWTNMQGIGDGEGLLLAMLHYLSASSSGRSTPES